MNEAILVVDDEQVLARNMIVEVAHPLGGSTKMPGNPIKLSDTHEDIFSPPPTLGQHNDEVYASIGLTADELEALQEDGII